MADDLFVLALGAAAAPLWVGPTLLAAGLAAGGWWALTCRRPHRGRCACGDEQDGRR